MQPAWLRQPTLTRRNVHPRDKFGQLRIGRGGSSAAIFIFHSVRARAQRVTQNPPPSSLLSPGGETLWSAGGEASGGSKQLLSPDETGQETQIKPGAMALLCYNKGCGLNFDAGKNKDGESLRVFVPLSARVVVTGAMFPFVT